jgi:pimeloyl-ACP methyl ester carboxylesterase
VTITRQRAARIVVAIAAGLSVGVAVDVARSGGIDPWLARRGLAPLYLPEGERIAVGGGSFYLDCRGSGRPTVILEAGAGGGAGSWSSVFNGIAATTRTCAYDRAGLGSSDPRGTRTLGDAATDLRALLATAGESPPFVIAGHSLGGSYARVFAAQERDETVGLVLLETFDPDLETAHIHPLLGDLQAEYADRLDGLRNAVASWENLDWPTSEAQLRAADVTGLRIAVLVARRGEPRLDAATNARISAAWEQAYEGLSPGLVTYEYADGSGHLVQIDRPDLVIAVIQRVVAEARRG